MTVKQLNVINEISDKYGHIAEEYEGENSFLCYGICSTNGLKTEKTKQTFFLVDIDILTFNKLG